jgi:hypothetical protein
MESDPEMSLIQHSPVSASVTILVLAALLSTAANNPGKEASMERP